MNSRNLLIATALVLTSWLSVPSTHAASPSATQGGEAVAPVLAVLSHPVTVAERTGAALETAGTVAQKAKSDGAYTTAALTRSVSTAKEAAEVVGTQQALARTSGSAASIAGSSGAAGQSAIRRSRSSFSAYSKTVTYNGQTGNARRATGLHIGPITASEVASTESGPVMVSVKVTSGATTLYSGQIPNGSAPPALSFDIESGQPYQITATVSDAAGNPVVRKVQGQF